MTKMNKKIRPFGYFSFQNPFFPLLFGQKTRFFLSPPLLYEIRKNLRPWPGDQPGEAPAPHLCRGGAARPAQVQVQRESGLHQDSSQDSPVRYLQIFIRLLLMPLLII